MVSESDFDCAGDEEDFGELVRRRGVIYMCSVTGCEKTFRRKDRLRHHLCVHEGQKPYVCTHAGCDKAYTRPEGLKRHVSNCHAVKKYTQVYGCSEENCDKKFKFLSSLHRHVKRVHEDRQIQCSYCQKTFKKRQQLKIHEFQHTGIKPFKCSVDGCSKEFLLPSRLKAHMKYHKGYKCTSEGCESTFSKWTLLRKHLKVDHVPVHKCLSCEQVFSTASILHSHQVTHGAEREIFACPKDDCSRFYYFERNLKQHLRAAHDDDDIKHYHECSHEGCGKKFKHKPSLDKHFRLHAIGTAINTKSKMTRRCRKRRSMAAHLSGYSGTKEEEMAILCPENCGQSTTEIPPNVVLLQVRNSVSCDQTTSKL